MEFKLQEMKGLIEYVGVLKPIVGWRISNQNALELKFVFLPYERCIH